jgi:acetyltransferase-like isoleucine patch superfamily enzyme
MGTASTAYGGRDIRKPRVKKIWAQFWMKQAHRPVIGRAAAYLAGIGVPPYYGRVPLARIHQLGYVAPSATLCHDGLHRGNHCFIGDRVMIYRDRGGGDVVLGDGVHLHQDTVIQTGNEGQIRIGDGTHIQPRCQLSAYLGSLEIGSGVEIAPGCAFYPYNHSLAADIPIQKQPVQTKGGIVVGDDAWLGFGVVVLDGVKIGRGVVVGAGSVVSRDIPDYAIAVGSPARVVGSRDGVDKI